MEELIPYLPTDRRHAIADGVDLPDRTSGSAMFVDISGFTPLAEALAKDLGSQRGAEELTFFLNQVYNVLIADLDRCHGSVIGFSGDAITCWFDGDDGIAATACALSMQESMEQFEEVPLPSGERISLAAKAGIAVGKARRFAVGESTLIDVLAGQLLDEMAEAEHHASSGDVVLGPSAVRSIAAHAETQEAQQAEDGFSVVEELTLEVPEDPWPDLDEDSLTDEQLKSWLLTPVYERLQSGQGEFLAELRPAVALFLAFEGIDYDEDDDAGEKLNKFVTQTQRVLAEYEGTLVDITTGDKGSHLYIAFGAPLAHEDDIERAASAALDLQSTAKGIPFITNVHMGMSRGRLRTGAYGGKTRRTYGVLGDATNLAARLMQAAQPGEILLSELVVQNIESSFSWEDRSPIKAKGKAEPISVKNLVGRVVGRQQVGRQLLPMVGREQELQGIQDKVDLAADGTGQVIGVTAPAGMGKSRLLAEVVYSSIARGFPVFRGECKSYGTSSAYLPWETVWQEFFSLNPSDPVEHQIQALRHEIEEADPGLVPRLPLLGSVLNIDIPDSDLTQSFDAKLRKTSLESLLVDLMRLRTKQETLVFVLEDTHWIDPLSLDLLRTLGQAIARQPAILLMAYRPPEEGAEQPLGSLRHFSEVALTDLSSNDAEQWILLKLSQLYGAGSQAPPTFTRRLIERAEGNPFYIEEVLNYLKDHEIDLDDEAAMAEITLPASLHSLVLTRIDQLEEHPRTTLRVASIIGRSFKSSDLAGAHPQIDEDGDRKEDLRVLERKDFTELEDALLAAYLFKHSVIQEVAYESLPHITRARLHENFGGYIEREYDDSLDQHLDLLAYHFSHSNNEPKKRDYLRKAGEAAQMEYSNSAALGYYEQLLPLVSDVEQVDIELKVAQVFELLGEWKESDRVLRRALEVSSDLGLRESEGLAQMGIGEVYRKQGTFAEAATWLELARKTFESLGDDSGLGQVLHYQGTLAAQQGDYSQATKKYEESLVIRKKLDDKGGTASLLSNLGIIARFEGDFELAQELNDQSLNLRREVGDRWAIANSLNNQGTVFLDQEEYEQAQFKLEESISLLREIGDRWYYANALNNLANVARAQKRFEVARDLYLESLEINRELGDGWALSYLLEDIGYLNAAQGHSEKALILVGAAETLRSEVGAPLPPAEQETLEKMLEPARRDLSADEQEAALEEGRGMTLEQAIEKAQKSSGD